MKKLTTLSLEDRVKLASGEINKVLLKYNCIFNVTPPQFDIVPKELIEEHERKANQDK